MYVMYHLRNTCVLSFSFRKVAQIRLSAWFHTKPNIFMASSSASSSLHPKKEKAQTFSGLEKFDWAYLCNLKNTDEIRQNIQCRKGIGDIDTLLRVWKQVRNERENENLNLYSLVFFFCQIASKIH